MCTLRWAYLDKISYGNFKYKVRLASGGVRSSSHLHFILLWWRHICDTWKAIKFMSSMQSKHISRLSSRGSHRDLWFAVFNHFFDGFTVPYIETKGFAMLDYG